MAVIVQRARTSRLADLVRLPPRLLYAAEQAKPDGAIIVGD